MSDFFFCARSVRLKWGALLGLLAAAIGLACYWPALFGEPIWDDHALLDWNPFVRSPALIWQTFWNPLYPYSAADYYRPLQNLSYLGDYLLWGRTHFGYHLTNVLLHAADALLLFGLLAKILPQVWSGQPKPLVRWTAGGVALLWLVHPIHHAAVAYVAGRADSLAALLSLCGWLLYEFAIAETRPRHRAAGLLSAAALAFAALYAKEIALSWMGLFVFYRLALAPPAGWRLRVGTCSVLVLLLGVYLWHRSQIALTPSVALTQPLPLLSRFALALAALGDYSRILLCPSHLHMERRLTLADATPVPGTEFLALYGVLVLLVTAISVCRRGPLRRLCIFSTGWFFIGFLPVSNLFPLKAQVAEHWIYLASIGAMIPVTAGFMLLFQSRPRQGGLVAAVVLLILGTLTHRQSRTWVSEEGFFRATIANGGDTARMAWGLAAALEKRGAKTDAEQLLNASIGRFPQAGALRLSLAGLLMSSGRAAEAENVLDALQNSAATVPDPWACDLAWIRLRSGQGRREQALDITEWALERNASAWALQRAKIVLLSQLGRPAEARACLDAAVLKQPWNVFALRMLADLQLQSHQPGQALESYRQLARLDIRDEESRRQIARLE